MFFTLHTNTCLLFTLQINAAIGMIQRKSRAMAWHLASRTQISQKNHKFLIYNSQSRALEITRTCVNKLFIENKASIVKKIKKTFQRLSASCNEHKSRICASCNKPLINGLLVKHIKRTKPTEKGQ